MEINFGDIKITIPYEKYFFKYSIEKPFGAMFSKHKPDFFEASFKRAAADYTNYIEEYKKCMGKFVFGMNKSGKSEE